MNRVLQTVCTRLFTRSLLNLSSGILPNAGVNFIPCAGIRHHKLTDQQMRLRYKKLHWHKFYDDKWVQRRGGGWDEKLTPENAAFMQEIVYETYANKESPLKDGPWQRGKFTTNPETIRSGALGLKLGTLPQWDKKGRKFYVTLVQIIDNHVINYTPPEMINFRTLFTTRPLRRELQGKVGMLVVGALSCDPRKFTRAYTGLFEQAGIPPKRKLTRFFITPNSVIKPGTPLYATHFRCGDYVDVQARSIDYGFQGVMRRYGFRGGPSDKYGSTKFHRKRGTVGSGRKHKILPGTRMPGFMGNKLVMMKGLKVWRINTKYNVLYLMGPAVPGPNHGYMRIQDSTLYERKKIFTETNHPPFPTYYPDDNNKKLLDEELFADDIYRFDQPTLTLDDIQVAPLTARRTTAKTAQKKK
ncbi:unnamed protein product [Rotaria sp. Silwood1]|nr:unnamed protein product [Rotaria sp. Silwood1]CAF3443094.1 unnamed protein product [Rotaria sp. Silwood1]CAF3496419.1 unnamed protein product [Rotaria sp. Silwood1]CAF4725541.1 unnamed protein product [Rotaria sp. Silwood1]CAF4774418.1 unnamed protein product [Rotaria sp. Silwood1]